MIRGILFDKDGTLLDIEKTWGTWAVGALDRVTQGDRALARRAGATIGIDADTGAFDPEGAAVAGTLEEQADLLAPVLGRDARELEDWLRSEARTAVPHLIAPPAFYGGLASYALGVGTNDGEAAARAQLDRAGLSFPFVAGYDSGHGDPGAGRRRADGAARGRGRVHALQVRLSGRRGRPGRRGGADARPLAVRGAAPVGARRSGPRPRPAGRRDP